MNDNHPRSEEADDSSEAVNAADDTGEAVIAADDTGMISSERGVVAAEINAQLESPER